MSADEFDVIRDLFAPLATSAGARGLIDDVAVLEARGKLVITTDAIVEGVHFLPDDPIDTVAKKALRVNLSDLAAKGAKCVGVLLTLVWPDLRPSAQIAAFARGLGEDLKFYDVPLLGGDTTSTAGPLTISITALGEPLGQGVPSRADAQIGDDIWLTGAMGDAWAGLQALRFDAGAEFAEATARYRAPSPRVGFASIVAANASAALDVSDGLLRDAAKLARASSGRVRIELSRAPISPSARRWCARVGADLTAALNGGDDYEILFTAAIGRREQIVSAASLAGIDVSRIGVFEAGEGVALVGADGENVPIGSAGYVHRLGA